jgi:alpha-amylase
MKNYILLAFSLLALSSCQNTTSNTPAITQKATPETPFIWEAANMYFLLTDRFYNGDTTNDTNYNRTKETAVLRGFEGGDIKGIQQKIEEGYFTDLGINAIWFTPVVEQVHGAVITVIGLKIGHNWTPTLVPCKILRTLLRQLILKE